MTTAAAVLGVDRAGSAKALEKHVRQGLPYDAVTRIADIGNLTQDQLSVILGVSQKTLDRRKKAKLLSAVESDRAARVARVLAMAMSVLGRKEKVGRWLHSPIAALGGQAPISLLDTDSGVREVEDILGRIEHGVYS